MNLRRVLSWVLILSLLFAGAVFADEMDTEAESSGAYEEEFIPEDTEDDMLEDEEDSGINDDAEDDMLEDEEESSSDTELPGEEQDASATEPGTSDKEEEPSEPNEPVKVVKGKYNLLAALDIISDPDTFTDQKVLTRGELMFYFSKMSGVAGISKSGYTGKFTDVNSKTPYCTHIQVMENLGVISGNGMGNFYPESPVTLQEAVVAATKLLGYDIYALNAGGYPSGYYTAAHQAGITKGVYADANGYLSGENAVTLLFNVLTTELTVQSVWGNEGSIKLTNGASYLETVFKVYFGRGIVSANDITGLTSRIKNVSYGCVGIDGVVYKIEFADRNDMLGKKIDFYYKNNDETTGVSEIIWYEVNKNVDVIELDARDIDSVSGHTLKYTLDNEDQETIKFSGATDVIFNFKAYYEYTASEIKIPMGKITLIDNDNDGTYDVINILSFEEYVVQSVNEIDNVIYADDGTMISLPDSDDCFKIIKNGIEIPVTEIYSGMVINVAGSKDNGYIKVYTSNVVVTGTVKEVINDGTETNVNIDGTSYILSVFSKYSPMAGDYGSFYLNYFGEIAAKDRIVTNEQYAYLITLRETGPEVDKKYYFKLLTEAGVETFEAAEKIKLNDNPRQSAETVYNSPELYANGTKDENGAVTEQQLIMFKTDKDGKLNFIKTYIDYYNQYKDDPYFKKDKDDMNFTMDYDSGPEGYLTYYAGTVRIFGTKYLTDAHTKLFFIPSLPLNDSEDYYSGTIASLVSATKYYNISFYNIAENNIVGAVVLKQDNAGGISITNSDANMVISKITTAFNDDEGIAELKIYGYVRGAEKIYLVNDLSLTDAETKYGNGLGIKDLKPGDVIQVSLDKKGYVSKLRILNCYNPETFTYKESSTSLTSLYTALHSAIGKMIYRDDTTATFNCTKPDSQTGMQDRTRDRAFNFTTRTHFYRVNTKTGQVKEVKATDIPEDSLVYLRSGYCYLNDVIYYE